MSSIVNIGLDAGSTTVKVAAIDSEGQLLFKDYSRHHADISDALKDLFSCLREKTGQATIRIALTGSAGMGIAERCHLPFIQEVVASCCYIARWQPAVKTLVDIGGEDAKLIFFEKGKTPDIRMNNSCAGGTGAFIDQMATLLGADISELEELAQQATTIYPIASRCGVFSKTDIQNLLSRNICKEDIAASVFHAVSMQVVTSLSRGYEVRPPVFLCGGPFHFIPSLRKAFAKQLNLSDSELVQTEHSEIIPAWGAAIHASKQKETNSLDDLISLFETVNKHSSIHLNNRLKPLFADATEYEAFIASKSNCRLPQLNPANLQTDTCFIGIDSGSTTTKIVALDKYGRMFFHYYASNHGQALDTVSKGLADLATVTEKAGKKLNVGGSCVTGYGEDLLKKAFNISNGVVETMAHYTAACHFEPAVSFILDIGGQDMKAAFIEKGAIKRLEINEACSSGCGSFIETFAQGLNYQVVDFARIATTAKHPCDLGTRCTVFMNSKVKQFLREGAPVADISAGLAYSVIKNCLNKVLKLKNFSEMGDHIMLQGGAFRNQALIRAFELETGKTVMVTDYPELLGAYGAALFAIQQPSARPVSLADFVFPESYSANQTQCKGCENQCAITRFKFDNGNVFFAGNNCEKMVGNTNGQQQKGINLYAEKYDLLFDRQQPATKDAITIGIPRALGLYENFPFWHTLLTACGFNVQLSDPSTMPLYETGIKTVMADNICFPAKLANAHILNLIEKKVDRIFMPFVVYEFKEDASTVNSYNCPIVSAYSEVIRSAIDPEGNAGIPFDAPTFTFKNKTLMEKGCLAFLSRLPSPKKLSHKLMKRAFNEAILAQQLYQQQLVDRCHYVYQQALKENRPVIVLAGRPYHTDPLIQHKLAQIVAGFGADVITEDIVRMTEIHTERIQSITQWAYPNRIIKAATLVADAPENVHFFELTSFGCGPDAFMLDEVSDILRRKGKFATFLKIDDINNIGSNKLRIRSQIESLKHKGQATRQILTGPSFNKAVETKPFEQTDQLRTILLPWFADFYSPLIPPLFKLNGYKAVNLPPSDEQSATYGLKYSNNEICYPATLVIGDFMKALDSHQYNPDEIALAITQTGGQCRATSYASLLKKALISAGLERIPVITIALGGGANNQPGFHLNMRKTFNIAVHGIIFADCLAKMYYATLPREKEAGAAEKLKQVYLTLAANAIEANDTRALLNLIAEAADRFTGITVRKEVPQIGVVGEIYVKYNNFGHKDVVKWLGKQGIETVLPPIIDYFTSTFVNRIARKKGYVDIKPMPGYVYQFAEKYIYQVVANMEKRCRKYPYFSSFNRPEEIGKAAAPIINLNAQFGEGWNIPGDFAHFAQTGINKVISLQPFGCIANQIISKGIEKRTRKLYPNLNLLFLDFDSGMSEANLLNRLHFMLEN